MLTHITKFVIHVTKFVTKIIYAERKKYHGLRKNYHGGNKKHLRENFDFLLDFPPYVLSIHLHFLTLHIGNRHIYIYLSVEYSSNKDKNHKNRLLRLKPKGTPQGLMPSLKASRLCIMSAALGNSSKLDCTRLHAISLVLNPSGCGRFPPASNDASKKQIKVDIYFSL